MVDLEQARTLIVLRTWDRNGCLPGCSFDSVCKTWPILQQTIFRVSRSNLDVAGLSLLCRVPAFVWYRRLRRNRQTKDVIKVGGRRCKRQINFERKNSRCYIRSLLRLDFCELLFSHWGAQVVCCGRAYCGRNDSWSSLMEPEIYHREPTGSTGLWSNDQELMKRVAVHPGIRPREGMADIQGACPVSRFQCSTGKGAF